MHLLIPFASTRAEACGHALHDLALPNLCAVLTVLTPTGRDTGEDDCLSPPHERALGAALGWPLVDGLLPWAAFHAAADGVDTGDASWGELTPVHVHVGTDQITLLDPAALQFDDATSKAFLESMRNLFESAGWRLAWGGATRWYAAHPSLEGLATASLDRVIGRHVDPWTAKGPQARPVRALQNEVQMMLYRLPLNDEREARGALALNSFWVSGCGMRRPAASLPDLTVAEHLRQSALAEDWAEWRDAWRALDAGPVAALLQAARAARPVKLTLCGERSAQTFESRPQPLWKRLAQRWQSFDPNPLLEQL